MAGTHAATFFVGDLDNRLQRYDFTFTVAGAGDFNGDGKEDLTAWTEEIGSNNIPGTANLYVI